MKFSTLLRHMKGKIVNDVEGRFERAERRIVDVSICEIDGTVYPVANWSASGVLLAGDERLFAAGETIHMKLRFRLSDRIIEIPHSGTVARKAKGIIALHFDPLPLDAAQGFSDVIADYNGQYRA